MNNPEYNAISYELSQLIKFLNVGKLSHKVLKSL